MAEDSTTPGALIGRNVRAAREAQLLSRPDLAERSGVAKPTIAALELRMSARPRRRTVEKLADALGISVEELMSAEPPAPKGEAPPSQEKLFNNGVLDEERRGYEVPDWLTPKFQRAREALDRYCLEWERRLAEGELDLKGIERFFEDAENWEFILDAAVWAELGELVRSGRVRVDPNTDDPQDDLDKLYGVSELGQAGLRHIELADQLSKAAKALHADEKLQEHMERQAQERRARFTVHRGELSA